MLFLVECTLVRKQTGSSVLFCFSLNAFSAYFCISGFAKKMKFLYETTFILCNCLALCSGMLIRWPTGHEKKVVDKVTKMSALLAEFHHICKSGIYSDTWPGWPDLLNDLYRTNKIFLKAYHSVSTTPDNARHDQIKRLLRF